jgi:CBS domain containing-hemolysin-like protein
VLSDGHTLDQYIAACQIGITLSSLILGAYGQATLTPALGPLLTDAFGLDALAALSTAAVIVLVGLTFGQMILGELMPKSLALQFPTQLARWTVIPMQWSLRLMSWFIVVLNGSGTAILRAIGMHDASGHRHIHSPDEIELLIAESRDGGLLEPDEHRRLRQALQLGVRTVAEIMVPRRRIQSLSVGARAEEIVRTMEASPFSRLPVHEDTVDQIIGFVHARDVAVRALEADRSWSARDIMRPVLVVPEQMTVDRLLARMREERSQFALAMDEFGGTAGLVTLDDVLDEVMGDVGDERQPRRATPEPLPDGRVRLPGALRMDDAVPWLGAWKPGEAHTVGGRIMEVLGRVPTSGEAVCVYGTRLEIERVESHAIESVLVSPAQRASGNHGGRGATDA